MDKISVNSLMRRKLASFLFVSALIIILVIVPLATTSLQNAQRQIETDITYYSRGSYDLLIRAPGSKHHLEEEHGIVPENYIGFGEGGISLEQWELIKNRPDVEIAAPVASVGYFTGVTSNIGLELPVQSTAYTTKYYTSDGVQSYQIGNNYDCILLESPKSIKGWSAEYESLYNDPALMNFCRDDVAMFPLPTTYNLLVGIDPEQEEALTKISFEPIRKDTTERGWGAKVQSDFLPHAKTIPVLELKHDGVSIEADITTDLLDIRPEDTQVYRNVLGLQNEPAPGAAVYFFQKANTPQYKKLVTDLLSFPEKKRRQIISPLGSHLNGFQQDALIISDDGKIKKMEADGTFIESISLNFSTLYYTAGQIQYKKKGDNYIINKLGDINGVPVYRKIQEKGASLAGVANDESITSKIEFVPDPVGSVDISNKKEQLASSPLGIYQFAPVYYVGDETKKPIKMKSTITPGSFVSVAAKGVTNIESAALIKGDTPIDAIRVRVAEINGYTTEAAKKIEEISKEIEEMGLEVTTVAGSSSQKLRVEVEGVGNVDESWTTLGAAGTIVNEWNITNLLLTVLFGFVTITYIFNRMKFWQVTKQSDVFLFHQIGWDRNHIVKQSRKEILILLFIATIVSIAILIVIQNMVQISKVVYLWYGFQLLVMTLVLLIMVKSKVNKTIDSLRRKKFTENKPRFSSRRKSLIIQNLIYFKHFISIPFIQIILVSVMSSFIYLSLTETVKITNVTLLGEYINLQSTLWHYFLIGGAYILAIITLIESISTLMITRKKEFAIFRSIGWRKLNIFFLYLKELAIWTGVSISLGSIITAIVFTLVYSYQTDSLTMLFISCLGFYIVILGAGIFVIQHFLTKDLGTTLSFRRYTTSKRHLTKSL